MKIRKLVNIITWPMKAIGVNPLVTDNLFSSYVRIFIICFLHIIGIFQTLQFSLHANGDFFNTVIPTAYGVCLVMVCVAAINEEYLPLEYEGFLAEESFVKLYFLVLGIEIAGFLVSGSSPLVGYIVLGKFRAFIYPGWVPWEVNSKLSYIITTLLQVPVASSVFWVYYVSQVYLTFTLVEFLRQFKRLQIALETLNDRTSREVKVRTRMICETLEIHRNEDYCDVQKSCFNEIFKNKLIFCIKHHQKLYMLFKEFKVYYEIFFSAELLTVGVSFSLLLYCLVEASDSDTIITLLGITWLLLSNLFCRCFIGEQFSAMNSGIQETLFYDTAWYNQNMENRKLIFTFHLFLLRTFTLNGLWIWDSSFFTFSGIVRKSYSYFNLIRASQSK